MQILDPYTWQFIFLLWFPLTNLLPFEESVAFSLQRMHVGTFLAGKLDYGYARKVVAL